MPADEVLRDQRLLHEISRITSDYGTLHRHAVRDLARCRAELVQAHTVLGTVAHDLRSPLSTVVGFTELLLDEELTPAQRSLGDRVSRAARTMTRLTDELVESVTFGASPVRRSPVDLVVLVSHAVTRHQLLRPARGVRVALDTHLDEEASAIVHGDEAKLERIVDNLLSNALKFSPDRGTVHVSVSAASDSAEIRVRDDGPGLPPDELEKVFSPFHRAPGATTVPGVGLGLTIVQQVVERHGGRVHAESVLGEGATFVVRLPSGVPSAA